MSGYRKEWPCCGDETYTEAWEPEKCPFCELNDAKDSIAELETELEAAQAPASGEVEPVAWSLRWPEDEVVNAETTFRTEELARRYANRCQSKGVTVVPVYAHPPASQVPEGVWEALQRLIESGGQLGPASRDDALLVAKYRHALLTTPGNATHPQSAQTGVREGWQIKNAHGFWEVIRPNGKPIDVPAELSDFFSEAFGGES